MAVTLYTVKQDNSSNEAKHGKWYGRIKSLKIVEIEELAAIMQDNCTVKRADILAVLSELGPTMRQVMSASQKVRIPYLGIFSYGITTIGAESEEKFTAANITKVRVNFLPARKNVLSGGTRATVVDLCSGLEFKKYDSSAAATTSGSTSGSSDSGSTSGDSGDDPIDQRP